MSVLISLVFLAVKIVSCIAVMQNISQVITVDNQTEVMDNKSVPSETFTITTEMNFPYLVAGTAMPW